MLLLGAVLISFVFGIKTDPLSFLASLRRALEDLPAGAAPAQSGQAVFLGLVQCGKALAAFLLAFPNGYLDDFSAGKTAVASGLSAILFSFFGSGETLAALLLALLNGHLDDFSIGKAAVAFRLRAVFFSFFGSGIALAALLFALRNNHLHDFPSGQAAKAAGLVAVLFSLFQGGEALSALALAHFRCDLHDLAVDAAPAEIWRAGLRPAIALGSQQRSQNQGPHKQAWD
jgi:hypothetical protein